MTDSLDLDAYLARIGHSGDTAPTRETLATLVLAHATSIPFENLDPLLGRPIRLDAASVQQKLVAERRGGYCFEHNSLLALALTALGFPVTALAARVVRNQPAGTPLPRTHMLLAVEVGGDPVIVDVGYGGLTLTGVLRMEADAEQETPHEPFRLARLRNGFGLEALVGGTWTPLYEFDLTAQLAPDIEMMNHFTATWPQSIFRHTLMAARATDEGRLGLRNNTLSIHRLGTPSEQRALETAAELREVLADTFTIALPDDASLDAVLERFARGEGG